MSTLTLETPSIKTVMHDYKNMNLWYTYPATALLSDLLLQKINQHLPTNQNPEFNPSTVVPLPLDLPALVMSCDLNLNTRKHQTVRVLPNQKMYLFSSLDILSGIIPSTEEKKICTGQENFSRMCASNEVCSVRAWIMTEVSRTVLRKQLCLF